MDLPERLYDLSPLLPMMVGGILIALGPLAWLWLRHRAVAPLGRLHALTLLMLFLTFDLIMFGAFTRLSDSGLGCPDWPGCYGSASPMGARGHIAAAQLAMPTGPVTHLKAWIEMIHRYLATSVGVLVLVLLGATLWQRRGGARRGAPAQHAGGISAWWPAATLVWICMQGAFGALTVTMRLFPAIVTLHLLGGAGLLVLLVIQAERLGRAVHRIRRESLRPALRALLWVAAATVALQMALGGWVSTNYAVLACDTFPRCQGSWWPPMDFAQGFEVWRPLGQLASGAPLEFAALTAIHYTHRLFAYVVLVVLFVLFVALRRAGALRAPRRWIVALALVQLATGLSNVILGWPIVAALVHTGGAAALLATLTWTLSASRVVGAGEGAPNTRKEVTA